jgi:anti-sigma factor RsiW
LGSLSEYVDGELDPALCAEIERHMAECENCQIMVDTLRKTIILYRAAGHRPVPEEVKARLYAVLRMERATKRPLEVEDGD